MYPKAKLFAESFVRLWRQQRAAGIKNPRVGRLAALTAGYGQNSWCEERSVQAADMMVNKLLRRPDVLAYIYELGLERDGRHWRDLGDEQADYPAGLDEALIIA